MASPSERQGAKDTSRVSVNLLPRELAERLHARRVGQYTVGAVVLLIALMGAGYALRLAEVGRAEQARDEAQVEVTRLETELAKLAEYGTLADLMESRNTLLASAMEREIAFSVVLNDLSLAFPANASLQRLTITAEEPAPAVAGTIDFGESVARAEFGGYALERYAPGVETVLVDFDRAHAFFNTFLTTASKSAIADTEVTDFSGTVALDRDAYTGRYADGLPPEETP